MWGWTQPALPWRARLSCSGWLGLWTQGGQKTVSLADMSVSSQCHVSKCFWVGEGWVGGERGGGWGGWGGWGGGEVGVGSRGGGRGRGCLSWVCCCCCAQLFNNNSNTTTTTTERLAQFSPHTESELHGLSSFFTDCPLQMTVPVGWVSQCRSLQL